MKKTFLFFFLLATLSPAAYTQSAPAMSEDLQKELPQLLRPGMHIADVIGKQQISSTQLAVIGRDTIEIMQQGNTIAFKGHNRLRPLDSVRIDLVAKQVLYRGEHIPYSGMINMDDNDKNPLKISQGYEFSLKEEMSGVTPPETTKEITPARAADMMRNMSSKEIRLVVGHVKDSNRVALIFMAIKITKGRSELAVITPVIFE